MGENRRIVKYFREKIVKSFLDTLILKTLKDEPGLTGYNMMTRFNEKFGIMLSSGTIYSTLHGLEGKGLIQSIVKGRGRTYTLTDHGKSFIDALMGDHQIQQLIFLVEKPVSNTHAETMNLDSHVRVTVGHQ
jgi:DNA-binding PadR family transcriptional regulator